MNEVWRSVLGYEGIYEVSNCGSVRSLDRVVPWLGKGSKRRGKVLKNYLRNCGYYIVNLSKNGIVESETVHRLVAIAFLPNPLSVRCVNHKDANKLNNHVENLEWVTHQGNTTHAQEMGLWKPPLGEKNGKSVLTLDQAKQIKVDLTAGETAPNISRKYNVSLGAVHGIRMNRSWKYLK